MAKSHQAGIVGDVYPSPLTGKVGESILPLVPMMSVLRLLD